MKKKYRFLSAFLVFCLCIGLMPMSALATGSEDKPNDKEIWDGSVATSYAAGSGTQSDPYQIENGQQLALLAQETLTKEHATEQKYYVLTADIYLNDIDNFAQWE